MDIHSKLANGKVIFFLLFLFLLANFIVIQAIYPKFQTLDTLSSYTPDKAFQLISSYGEQGRQYYAVIEVTLDLVYPLVTALLFSLMIFYTFKRAFPGHSWALYTSLAPYPVLLADYLENVCIVSMLLTYPQESTLLAQLSNFFTIAKFSLAPLQLLFAVGLIGWLVQTIRLKRSKQIAKK